MISNEGYSTAGKSLDDNTRSKGSTCTVRFGSRNLPLYPHVIVCLGLLNTILLLTAVVIGIYCGKVSEEAAPFHITAQELFTEVKQLQIIQSEVIQAQNKAKQALEKELRSHEHLKLQLERNKTLSDILQRQLETLQVERATLLSNTSDIRESCGRCLPGWFLLNASCYFHGRSSASSPLRNWTESRTDCLSRGADLAVINNWEEQLNLFEHLPKLHPSVRPWWSRSGGVWVGLTDMQTEGTWVWINNVTVLDGGYWIQGEPNNYGVQGENCGALMNIDTPRRTWFDGNCQVNREWLCEMRPS
ncbi:CD209 antigen-like protein B [Toxotes jaculatrix]|uniref:CD209 antigen-like protein B n=1 Tax=Toxotes jaculatrix TaxID=941984 RepID=UPI001B3B12F4|nr:CD209 antigen-like protein B [Toxotes jaculatrix]